MIAVPKWFLLLLIVAVAVLLLILWSVKRRRRPFLRLEPIDSLDELKRSLSGLTQGTFIGGNKITLLQNGHFFERLYHDLRHARASVNIEAFLCKDGQVTRELADILAARAEQKVKVHVLVDGSGGRKFGREAVRRMTAAGCQFRQYHSLRLSNLGLINNRTHRKMIIIDGRVGYIGGHCLVDSWLGNADDKQHFRDISARVEGPVVAQLQSAFTDNWVEETGQVIGGDDYFPELPPAGDQEAQVVFALTVGGPSTLKILHYAAIETAKRSITIQNPYFLPDPDARKALVDAAARGVDVRIMIPASEASDAPIVQHASHHRYGMLLEGGVKLFDYHRTLLHQKVFVIDGRWCSIGSTNFDDRSFEINDEVSMVVFDEGLAQELEQIFEADRKFASEATLDSWKRRPLLHRLKDFSAFLINEQL